MAKSGAELLREFVVSIGFEVDDAQFRNFEKGFKKVEQGIAEIAGAVATATAIIEKNVNVMAARFEKLYFASQRSGASVRSLQNLEYGAQNIGFAAGQATAQIEQMQSALRSNPGLQAIFGAPGGDPVKNFLNIIGKLKELDNGPFGHVQASRYAGLLGISEQDLVLYEKGYDDLKKFVALRDEIYRKAGVDPDQVAAQSHQFENDMRLLGALVDTLKTLVLIRFLPAIDWLIHALSRIVEVVANADKATHGGSTVFGVGGGLLVSALLGIKTIGAVLAKFAGGEALGGAAALGGGASISAILTPVLIAAVVTAVVAYLAKSSGLADRLQKFGEEHSVRKTFNQLFGGGADGEFGVQGNNPGNLRAWEPGQATFERKGSGTFVTFKSAMDGISAAAGNLLRYGAQGLDTVSAIISKWAPKKDHNATEAYIASAAAALHVGANKHLNLSDPGTLQALLKTIFHTEQGRDPYSDTLIQQAVQQRLARDGGRYGHSVSQQTTINIDGAGDPKAVAQEAANQQIRVSREALRDLVPKTN